MLKIASLRDIVAGSVIFPGDGAYDAARTVFYGGIDSRPAAIVRAANRSDVSRVIAFARDTNVALAVRGGGHSFAGHSTVDGGLVLDLRELKTIEFDPDGIAAWAGAGLTAREFTEAAAARGLSLGFGDTGSVGIAGLTLGGGIGYFVREQGLTIDSLLGADLVTAEGQVVRADAQSHPDLFWAIRGGGGNFGVATRFRFHLHRLDGIVGGMLFLPATAETIAEFIAAAEEAPEELSVIANVMPAPSMPFVPAEHHGKLIVFALMAYSGTGDAAERAIAPFRKLAPPIADMVRPMRTPEIYPPDDESYHPKAVAKTMFVDRIGFTEAEAILDYLQRSDATLRVAQLRVLGGAMARVPVDATAFAHRQSRILVNVAAFYEGPEDRALREAWVAEFAAALRQKDTGAYVNFLGTDGPDAIRAAYPGSTWDRLRRIKARYDPMNFFRLNQNFPPQADR